MPNHYTQNNPTANPKTWSVADAQRRFTAEAPRKCSKGARRMGAQSRKEAGAPWKGRRRWDLRTRLARLPTP